MDSPGDKTAFRMLLLPGIVAIVVRLAYWLEHLHSPFFGLPLFDQQYYHQVAVALAAGEPLTPFGGFRPLLYPMFLSLFYRLSGAEGGILLAVFAQHLLGIVTTLMVAVVAFRLFRARTAGTLAGLLYALAGPPLYFEGELLIAAFMAFLVGSMFLVLSAAAGKPEDRGWASWLGAGVIAGLAVQARPNAILFLPAFPALWLWQLRTGRRRSRPQILGALGAAVLVLTAFGFVNHLQSGRFQLLTGAGGINFYAGNSLTADGMMPRQAVSVTYSGPYRDSIQVFSEQRYREEMNAAGRTPSSDPSQISAFWYRKAFAEIASAPGLWAGRLVRKAWYLCWNREIANNMTYSFIAAEESRLLRLLPVSWWLLFGLLPVGVAAAWRQADRSLALLILMFLAFYGLGLVAFFVNARFRIPCWPLMAVFGGGALAQLWRLARERNMRSLAAAAAWLALFAAISLGNWAGVPEENYARDHYFRSRARLERGDADGAVADIRRSLALEPGNNDAWLQMGNALFARGDYGPARDIFRRVTEAEPFEARAWNNLGAALEHTGAPGEAYAAYARAIELDDGQVNALISAAWLEIRAGMYAEAERHVQAASAISPARPDLLTARALVARHRGREADAEEMLRQARETDPALVGQLLRQAQDTLDPEILAGRFQSLEKTAK